MDTPNSPTRLVDFILTMLEARGWSQRRLAEVADLSPGALSRVLRGLATPETRTVEKIADAFNLPRIELLQMLAAEPTNFVARPESDPEVNYLVRRLARLTPGTRRKALDTITSLLDTITDIEERQWDYAKALTPEQQAPRDIYYEFSSIYHEFHAFRSVLRERESEEQKKATAERLVTHLHRFRLLLSALYNLPAMANVLVASVLIRMILQFVDSIFLNIRHWGRPQQQVWEELGGGLVGSLEYVLLLQAELGYYVLDEVTASEQGMERHSEGTVVLIQTAQRLLDELAANGQLWASAL